MHDARCTAHAPHVGAGGAGGVGNWLAIDGGFGVEIFFVLSGFLITWMLRGELDKTGSIGLVDFYRSRAARLLPVFYAYLLFSA
jgi:peptidoglycan/LPS O-acetylase OafA/YrhL